MFGNGCFLLAGSRSWKNISDVAGMAGFEPTISESKSGVLPLHYIPISGQKSSGIGITPNPRFRGVGKGVRTLDTRNHNPVLSRLSYTHHRSEMVRQEGFEPPAYCLEGSCSIQLSYCRILNLKICFSLKSASLLYISKLHLSTLFLIFYNYFPVLI